MALRRDARGVRRFSRAGRNARMRSPPPPPKGLAARSVSGRLGCDASEAPNTLSRLSELSKRRTYLGAGELLCQGRRRRWTGSEGARERAGGPRSGSKWFTLEGLFRRGPRRPTALADARLALASGRAASPCHTPAERGARRRPNGWATAICNGRNKGEKKWRAKNGSSEGAEGARTRKLSKCL